MRRFLIAGNWKMNCGPYDAAELLEGLKAKKAEVNENVDVLVCPPFVSIGMAVNYLHDTDIQVGAQNLHFEENGAFTGEISGSMIAESGCNYVIIGHSERRQYFGETDTTVNKRTHKALEHKLAPIVCVGESLDQRKSDKHYELVKNQVTAALFNISEEDLLDVVIAYEPIWAIGTGETASPEQAQEMHEHIRKIIAELYSQDAADQVNILYGGSMKPANAHELLSQPDVDGGLIGGASLDADSFSEIITIAEELA
ncbi:MAG: triose-phosphate isomerase [Balneola sp.]|jgi:triosephosphate isomerase|nr:triose-phosphate isomerase [Balneola sp.]MBE80413.1 triose-phosphate isomerase [Balneola sp.]HBX66946.1 triose-phosphate isomerase [Balneolaceae bacterium]|tara:strand:+ start:2288 stop:3055 length:768 start_codon:yes stop_codon:yes gene_type:complete